MKQDTLPLNTDGYDFDFVISYASEDNEYAQNMAKLLADRGAKVFYAPDMKANLWGQNLYEYLVEMYSQKGRFCIPLISRHYVNKLWTLHEWRSAQERILAEVNTVYLLPVRIDDAQLPGLLSTTHYLEIGEGLEAIAQSALDKLMSLDPLRSTFPKHWNVTQLRNPDIADAGENWLVEIIDQSSQTLRGDFHLYRQVTNQKRVGRRIGMKIRTSVIRYLLDRHLPVLLHIFHISTKTGYWMWLKDCSETELLNLERRKNITVNIPIRNVMSNDLAQITATAQRFYTARLLQKRAERTRSSNFRFQFHSSGDSFGVSVHPKHEKALEENPITVTLSLKPEGNEQFLHALELGEPVELDGQVTIEGLPDWLVPNAEQGMTITVLPLVRNMRSHICMEYYDRQEELLLRSNFVEFCLVQDGTKLMRWHGKASNQPIFYTITFDAVNQKTGVNLSFDPENRNPVELDWYLEIMEQMRRARTVTITNLETDASSSLSSEENFVTERSLPEPLRKFIKSLATVVSALHVDIPMPKEVRVDVMTTANLLAEIIETGRTAELTIIPAEVRAPGTSPVLIGTTTAGEARQMLDTLDVQSEIYVPVPGTYELEFLGRKLDLGPAQYLFCTRQFLKRDELEAELDACEDNDAAVEVHLLIDAQKSYANFLDYPKGKESD